MSQLECVLHYNNVVACFDTKHELLFHFAKIVHKRFYFIIYALDLAKYTHAKNFITRLSLCFVYFDALFLLKMATENQIHVQIQFFKLKTY